MTQKTYLVTGATSGMGRAVSKTLHGAGHRQVLLVREGSRKKDLPDFDGIIVEADFANPAQVEIFFAGFDTPLDGVINCAGILPGQSYTESTAADLTRLFNINTVSPMLMLKQLTPHLKPDACVVLYGSISGHKGSYDDGYAASKAAVHALVRSLALKLAPNVRVVGIAPGMTEETRMTAELIPGLFEKTKETRIPLKRAGKPEDMAALTLFVLGDSARFMTGCVIDVNGGQYLRT
jgi:NAD(P)-dependent dehydrogenase (short-subunit alcohol dehydrogenase family)